MCLNITFLLLALSSCGTQNWIKKHIDILGLIYTEYPFCSTYWTKVKRIRTESDIGEANALLCDWLLANKMFLHGRVVNYGWISIYRASQFQTRKIVYIYVLLYPVAQCICFWHALNSLWSIIQFSHLKTKKRQLKFSVSAVQVLGIQLDSRIILANRINVNCFRFNF